MPNNVEEGSDLAILLKAESRTAGAGPKPGRLRARGKVPAIVYGKGHANAAFVVDAAALNTVLARHPHAVIDLSVDGGPAIPVMIQDVQRDALTREILHADFLRINLREPVRVKVPLEAKGEAPGVKEGGILQWQTREVEIRCLPDRIPEALAVDVSALGAGDSILAGELALPEGIKLLHEPDEVIVTVLEAGEPAGEETAGEGGAQGQKQEANP
mgnify:CR=1 FL=1